MTKKRRLSALVLGFILLTSYVFCGFAYPEGNGQAVACAYESNDDIPIFALVFEKGTKALLTTAFLIQDTGKDPLTYLVTADSLTYLVEDGWAPRLLGPRIDEQAIYLASEGNFAFYYAPGLTDYEPLRRSNTVAAESYIVAPAHDEDYFVDLESYSADVSQWTKYDDTLWISGTEMPDSNFFGAPFSGVKSGQVYGCGTQANKGYLAVTAFGKTQFPEDASIEACEYAIASAKSSSDYVSGYWSAEKFYASGRWTYPFILNQSIQSCKGFTLDYEILSVDKGNVYGNFAIYLHTTNGKWKSVHVFNTKNDLTTIQVELDAPVSFDQIAVVPYAKGAYSYTHSIGIRNVVTNRR